MKKISPPIVFFGNERIATGVSTTTPTLRALIKAGYDIKAVVANFEVGRSRKPRPLEIAELAEQHKIPVLLPKKITDITPILHEYGAEVGVLVAYGKIVPQDIIDIFPRGIINIHPSLLPAHRGPTPLESIILSGKTSTGVSIMGLVKAMDAGPVYAQEIVTLSGKESKQELADSLLSIGSKMIIDILPAIINGSCSPTPQANENISYDRLITKQDGVIDWNKSAAEISREVRAYFGWPGSRTTVYDREVILTEVDVSNMNGTPGSIDISDGSMRVHCGQGSIIIRRLKPAGKKEMDATSFLLGIR